VHRYYFEGACFVEGGGAEMIRQLTASPFESHVDVFLNADSTLARDPVSGNFQAIFSRKSGQIRSEKVGEDSNSRVSLSGKRVIWTPDPRILEQVAPTLFSSLSPLNRLRMRSAKAPHALVVGYFATREPLEALGFPNRNVWLMGSLDSESCYLSYANEGGAEHLASQAALYVSTGSLRDRRACPAENSLKAKGVFQAMFVCSGESAAWDVEGFDTYRVPESKGGQGRAYKQRKAKVLERLVERLERAFPGVEASLVWKELGTPLTHQRYLHSLTRSGYGFAATVPDFLWARPSYESGIDGLHFCGAHVKPAHGIVTALVNGTGLAERILSWDNAKTSARNGRQRVEGLAATS
jgi:phytoene dehydrogenase-like protein